MQDTPSVNPWPLSAPIPASMSAAVARVEASPGDEACWEELERLVEQEQRPDVAEATYGRLLSQATDRGLAATLGAHAVRFHDEWSGEPEALEQLLRAVLRLDVGAEWAFERMTVVLTMGERWGELLSLYDQALAATTDLLRRREILDEATHIAKDFAGQPDRAIGYLWQLVQLRPSDAALGSSLERLLEARSRHADLSRLWELRASVQDGDGARALRLRAGVCWFERARALGEAVRVLGGLLRERYEEARVVELLEGLAIQPDEAGARREAFRLLESYFDDRGSEEDVLRVLEGGLEVTSVDADRARAHRKAAGLYERRDEPRRALSHVADMLPLEPTDREGIEALRRLGERCGEHFLVAQVLARAAERLAGDPLSVALQDEAASILLDKGGDTVEAARLLLEVFWSPEADAGTARRAGERLWREQLLSQPAVEAKRLPALQRLAELGPGEGELAPSLWLHDLLGEIARVAVAQGQPEQALAAWERRLSADPADAEAIDGRIDALERLRRWDVLLSALQQRADAATDEEAKRLDLVRIAKVVATTADDADRAIEAWREIEANFGREDDTVDALCELYERAGRPQEQEALLREAEAQAAGGRRAELRARLGELRARQQQDEGALESFLSALSDDPASERARQGLRGLLGKPSVGALALSGLVGACDQTDDWSERLSLLEYRVAAASDDERRADILVDAAADQEVRAGDAAAAQRLLGRALALNPGAIAIEQGVLRLASVTGLWAEAAAALESGLSVAQAQALDEQEGRVVELQARLGWVYEVHLSNLPRALDSYRKVARVDPHFPQILAAVVRSSVQLQIADATAEALIQATSRGQLDPALVAAIESNARGAEVFRGIIAALEPGLARLAPADPAMPLLLRQVGLWYRDHLGEPARAEDFLSRAIALDGSNVQAIQELAALQRSHPGRELIETLRALSAAQGGDEEALREAAVVALEGANDEALGLSILRDLTAVAQRRWQGGEATRSPEPARWYVRWAQDRVVDIHARRGEAAEAIQILESGARLPFSRGEVLEMLHRAASLARQALGDLEQAARLYREALALEAADATSLEALASILIEQGDHRALIDLRRHELKLELPAERRLDVRLSLARAAAALGDEAQVASSLRDNLRERPGHPVSVEELAALLSRGGRQRELLSLFVEQAGLLEKQGEPAAARQLWVRAAELAEVQLGDPSEAIAAQLRAAKIEETPEALDALGRLYVARGEPASAILWLERRLAGCAAAERTDVVHRLSSALTAVGRVDEARRYLEEIYREAPADRTTRSQLLALYRGAQAWPELVSLALTSAEHEGDAQLKIGLYLDAADVLLRRTNEPARAVEMLRRASALAPQDRGLRAGLADALRTSGQLDEARKILEDLLNEYGRRRPPERAAVHFQLAQLAQAKNDVAEALSQLDTASSMDIAHGGVLLLLGRLAFEARQFERSERAYRALLLILRRQRPEGPSSHQVDIGLSEVSFELYRVATQLGQAERAAELLESAFAAAQGAEAARLERALRAADETALLLRAILARKERAAGAVEQSSALVDLCLTYDALGREEEAFSSVEQALALTPDSDQAHAAARSLARTTSFGERYAARLRELAASSAPEPSAALWLRLGSFLEGSDLASAASAYEKAAETGLRLVEAWRALERTYRALGDVPRQIEALRALAELLGGDGQQLTEILYQLAALELASQATEEAGVATLERALSLEPRRPAALALLQKAAARKSCRDLLVLFERVAREAGEQALLLEALELLSSLPGAGDDVFREAVELADELFEAGRAEALLRAAVAANDGLWAMVALGQRHKNAGDWANAHAWLLRAAGRAEGDEAFHLGLEASAIAANQLKNKPLAVQLYHRFWSTRPGERSAWEPLLALLRGGDAEMLDGVLAGAAAASPERADRRSLRMERAEALLEDAFRQEDAIGVLQEILQEEPTDADAQAMLLKIYEQTGRADDLADLLHKQLSAACEQRSLDEIANLSLRLGGLLAKRRRDEAMQVYRKALSFLPNDPVLLRELLALLGPEGDPAERAQLLDRLLLDSALPDAPKVALQLADLRASLRDDEGLEAALRRGLALAPDDATIRARIEAFYTDRARWRPLADLLIAEADSQIEPLAAAAKLQKAALLVGKRLNEHRAAVDLLRRARALSSEDLHLLRALVDALLDAGENEAARDEVRSALDRTHVDKATRAQLLRLSALLAVRQGKEADAVEALEQAISLGAKDATPDLIAALEQLRASSARRVDAQSERAATLRLAALFLHENESEKGLALLRSWAQRQPGDLEALRTLLDLETAIGNWPAVVDLATRLIAADPEESKVEAALRLLDACTRAGAPENARAGLETAFASFPKNASARNALKQLYEQLNAQRELADILLHEAADTADEAARFAPYRRAAELYLAAGFASNAVPVLEAALHAKPGEHDCTVLLADCYISMNQLEQATNLLDAAIAGHKNKRSPQLSVLQHRMARVALAAGDRTIEVQWLNAALDSDAQNGQIAAELADVATEIGQLDLALKALRAITVAKNPGPMSKGMAFYRQGLISYHQGDQRKAVVMAKRGLQEDPSLTEARTFLEQLGEKV